MSESQPACAPLSSSDPPWIGAYRLVGRIGSGGTGVVYLALSPTGRYIALKRIRPELGDDPVFRARFRREVAAGRGVMDACVIRYLDADTEGDQPFLVTEYVDGPNLAEALSQSGPMPYPRLRSFAIGLAEAVQSLHRAGVTHRDLKPSNVLLAGDTPKVIDYGVSSAVEATLFTQSGTLVGSSAWMSPEQAVGRQITPAVDVFSWAALVAYAGTGRPPFGEGRPEAVLFRIVHETPDLDGLDTGLRALVEAGLAKDPTARPDASELIRWLAAIPASRGTTPTRGESSITVAPALAAPPPPPPPPIATIQPPQAIAPPVGPPPQPIRLPDPGRHQRSGRAWTGLLASVVVVSMCTVTVALAAHNGWGPFNTSAPLAPTLTPGISSDQPSVNPSAAAPHPGTQPTPPPFDAAAFQTPAFLLVKAAPAAQAVANVLAPTLDCLAIGAATSEQITTSGGDLPLTYECAGGGLDFGKGSGVFLFGEPQVQSDDSATILAGTPMSSQGSPPIGVAADPGTGGSTWWAMPVGVIAASALQANDARCSSVSEPSACIANLFTTAPEDKMEATPQFDHHYAQDLAFMYVKGYTLVPQNSWGASDSLHVLIGERPSTGAAPNERAYFFEDIGEIGIDTSNGSASMTVVAHTNNEVTLQYALYNPGDSASVGSKDVRFEWTGSKFLTLDPLPPSSPSTNGSRL